MNNEYDRNELLRRAVKLYQAEHMVPKIEYDAVRDTNMITERIAALAKETLDEAFEMSLENFMERENISASIVFDRIFVRELIKLCDPTPPVNNWFNVWICPHCKSEVDKAHDQKYCGRCGQRIDWRN